MKTKYLLASLLLSLVFLSGCDSLMLEEFDGISHNGSTYHTVYGWNPSGEQLKDKNVVYLENYDSTIDYNTAYNASSFEGDSEHVFLFFNHQLFVKDDYTFPDITNENVKIQKIVFYFPYQALPSKKKAVFENDDSVSLFMQEYRNILEAKYNALNRWNPKEYEVGIYILDYFAFYSGDSIGADKKGNFGIIDGSVAGSRVRLFSSELNKAIKNRMK